MRPVVTIGVIVTIALIAWTGYAMTQVPKQDGVAVMWHDADLRVCGEPKKTPKVRAPWEYTPKGEPDHRSIA